MYLLGAGLLITNFQLGQIEEGDATEHNVAGIVFAFPTVSYALLLAYNAVAFVCDTHPAKCGCRYDRVLGTDLGHLAVMDLHSFPLRQHA